MLLEMQCVFLFTRACIVQTKPNKLFIPIHPSVVNPDESGQCLFPVK